MCSERCFPLLVLLALLPCGCAEFVAPPGTARSPDGEPGLDPPGAVLPAPLLACGALRDRVRPVPSLEQTRQALARAATHAPVAQALRSAGMSAEEAAQLVWAAAAHNSGQRLDPVHARARQLNAAVHGALRRFNAELDAEQQRSGNAVDRAALNRRIGLPLARQEVLR